MLPGKGYRTGPWPSKEVGGEGPPRWSSHLFPDLERREHSTTLLPTPQHKYTPGVCVCWDPCLNRREAFPGDGEH